MGKLVVILVVSLILEAVGVVYLNRGLKELGNVSQFAWRNVKDIAWRSLTNRNILAGVAFEALFFGGILMLLAKGDVSFIWPLTSLGFVLTTLAAKFILGEEVSLVRWSGVLLIMAGACLIIWSEKAKPTPLSPPAISPAEPPPR